MTRLRKYFIVTILFLLATFFGGSVLTNATTSNEEMITKKQYDPKTPFVEDNADILSEETEQYIANLNNEIKDTKLKPQLMVVTLKTLNGYNIADVATQKGEQYQIGDEKQNTGLVYLISVDDRKDFLATGYGMETYITDAIASSILDNSTSHSAYSKGDYDKGILHNIKQIEPYMKEVKNVETSESENPIKSIFIVILMVSGFTGLCTILAYIAKISDNNNSGGGGHSGNNNISSSGSGGWSGGGGSFGGSGGGSSW